MINYTSGSQRVVPVPLRVRDMLSRVILVLVLVGPLRIHLGDIRLSKAIQ